VIRNKIPISINANIDVLFVIDNSPTMAPFASKLATNVRELIHAITPMGGPDLHQRPATRRNRRTIAATSRGGPATRCIRATDGLISCASPQGGPPALTATLRARDARKELVRRVVDQGLQAISATDSIAIAVTAAQ
jgi:hypothetical protein